VKKVVLVVSMGVGAFLTPRGLVLALCFGHYAALIISIRFVAGWLGTTTSVILRHVGPGVLLSLAAALPVYITTSARWQSSLGQLLAGATIGVVSYLGLSALTGCSDYVFVKRMIVERLSRARGV